MSASEPTRDGDAYLAMLEVAPPEIRRIMLFVIVAIKHDAWPNEQFITAKQSETEAEANELFHRLIRSIPQDKRAAVWKEVEELSPGCAGKLARPNRDERLGLPCAIDGDRSAGPV